MHVNTYLEGGGRTVGAKKRVMARQGKGNEADKLRAYDIQARTA
jgi:hypothetical protein